MSKWGALLLCAFIALGATSHVSRRTAGHIALVLTVAVVGLAMLSYIRGTPTDKYYKNLDSTVYATGPPAYPQNTATSEDESGIQPATPANTATIPAGGGG